MIVVNKPCSVIVLDINGLNFPKKTRTVLESKVHLRATFENHNIKGKHHLGVKEQKKKIPENRIKQRGIALLIFEYSFK